MSVFKYSQTAASNSTVGPGAEAESIAEGMPRAKVNDAMRGIAADLARYDADKSGALTTGTGAAYAVTTNSSVTSLTDGLSIAVKLHADSGASPTINLNGLGAKALKFRNNAGALTTPTSGRFKSGDIVLIFYSASDDAWVAPYLNQSFEAQTKPKNLLINGGFDIWQRGVSQTASGYGSADRWSCKNLGTAKTASLQSFTVGQTDVPGDPHYFMRHVVSSVAGSANYSFMMQPIENVRRLAGKTVTLTFWAKADAAKDIALSFSQYFGTGGSPSAAVFGIGAQRVSLTTSWQKFSITVDIPSVSGKTIGANYGDYLALLFWFDAGSDFDARTASLGRQSGTFDIARVSVNEGDTTALDDPFDDIGVAAELHKCKRYYRRDYIGVGTAAGDSGNLMSITTLNPEMRVAPAYTRVADNTPFGNVGCSTSTVGTTFPESALLYRSVTSGGGGNRQWFELAEFSAEL